MSLFPTLRFTVTVPHSRTHRPAIYFANTNLRAETLLQTSPTYFRSPQGDRSRFRPNAHSYGGAVSQYKVCKVRIIDILIIFDSVDSELDWNKVNVS